MPGRKKEEKPVVYIASFWDGEKKIMATNMTPEERRAASTAVAVNMANAYFKPKGYECVSSILPRNDCGKP